MNKELAKMIVKAAKEISESNLDAYSKLEAYEIAALALSRL